MLSSKFQQLRCVPLYAQKLLPSSYLSKPLRLIPLSCFSTSSLADRTALYELHVAQGGKMVSFGGYLLPVYYADQSIANSHLHTRRHVSIFDVSHMLQTYVRGRDAVACMESICTGDFKGLAPGSGTLTVFTNDKGGILDDLIVNKISSNDLYIVSNAAMKQQDMDIMESTASKFRGDDKDVSIEFLPVSERSLIAVQGPNAVRIVTKLISPKIDFNKFYFMQSANVEIAGVEHCRLTRCGYTGEDGFEISIPSSKARFITEELLNVDSEVKLAGLGARDSLRLEAGLCLYGSDINAETTPIEANLSWLIAKRRRNELNFPGANVISEQLKTGVAKRRIGLLAKTAGTPPGRAGVQIYHGDNKVGHITSGCPSPSLGYNIAMGYIAEEFKKAGVEIQLSIRGKMYPAQIAKMPFVRNNYYVKPKC